MAFTDQEIAEKAKRLESAGAPIETIKTFVEKAKKEQSGGFLSSAKSITKSQFGKAQELFEEAKQKKATGEPIEATVKSITAGAQAALSPIQGLFGAAAEKASTGFTGQIEKQLIKKYGKESGRAVFEKMKSDLAPQLEEQRQNIGEVKEEFEKLPSGVKTGLEFAGTGLEVAGALEGGLALKNLIKGSTKTLFTAPVKSVDDVIKQADTGLAASIRSTAEAEAPKISTTEKWAGVRPDIKKRISGKQDKLKEYFDIAHARNLDDTAPTPLEWGARQTEKARDSLSSIMGDTGSEIGRFRESVAKKTIPEGSGVDIRNVFIEELDKLNLTTNNAGKIVRKTGTVKKASDKEMKILEDLFDDLNIVRGDPTMQNMIDLRDAFGNKIDFAKNAKEASNVVDPLSRSVRSKIREVNIKAIGSDQAKLLDDYSDMIGLLSELNKFVESRSGGEFLLKRVLSERGRISRKIMDKLKDYTGIDLMDDATMAQLATEIIGNSAQKGLLQQEIARAGLNVQDILAISQGRAPLGAIEFLLKKGKEKLAPVEKMFLEAAQKKN
jgi:hypothetical protein